MILVYVSAKGKTNLKQSSIILKYAVQRVLDNFFYKSQNYDYFSGRKQFLPPGNIIVMQILI